MRYNPNSERFLVVEQKGLRILFIGLFLAFFTGLTFKAIFSPQRIKYEIEKAIEDSNAKQFDVKVEKAYLSLEKDWLPRLAVVVENLSLQSNDPCIYNALIKVDILTIPVSIRSILDRSLSLKRVEMENLRAHFQTLSENCPATSLGVNQNQNQNQNSNTNTNTNSNLNANSNSNSNNNSNNNLNANPNFKPGTNNIGIEASPNITTKANLVNNSELPTTDSKKLANKMNSLLPQNTASPTAATAAMTKNVVAQAAPLVQTLSVEGGSLEEIALSEGQFYVDTLPGFYIQLKKVKAYLGSQPEKHVQIEGTLELVPLAGNRLQGWHTRFFIDANPNFIKANIHGNWREGNINFDLGYKPKENVIALNGAIQQIPLSQVFVMGQNLGWWKDAPSARQSWVTLQVDYSQTSKLDRKLKINNFKAEGDFGDIQANDVVGENHANQNWKWSPIGIQIKNVIIEKLMAVFDFQHPSPVFASLGVFNGDLSIEGSHLKNLEGEIAGLEFIFSNKGKRDIQMVEKFDVSLKEVGDQYKYKIKNIEFKDGSFVGNVEGEWLQEAAMLQMILTVDQLTLNAQVESLMTNKGFLSPLQGKLMLQWKQGESPRFQGNFKIDKGQIEKVDFEKMKWDIESQAEESSLKVSIQNVKWNQNTNSYKSLAQILKLDSDRLDIKNISLAIKKKEDNLDWSDLQANLPDQKIKILSQGNWDDQGNLKGVIHLLKSDRTTRDIQVTGTRESPVFN